MGLLVYSPNYWESFTEMLKDIYAFYYDPGKVNDRVFKDTFGVQIDEINGKKVCVIQLNTVWSCTGENDERHLHLGRFQINKLKELPV